MTFILVLVAMLIGGGVAIGKGMYVLGGCLIGGAVLLYVLGLMRFRG